MNVGYEKLKKVSELLQERLEKEEKKEYLVQVHIIEARGLAAVDTTGASDPFIKITVGDKEPQVTATKSGASTVVYDQNFTFDQLKMTNIEFENFEVLLEAYDYNDFKTNTLIGSYSIGLSTLYRSPKHEFFNHWLPLHHPQKQDPQGFLLVSCYIVRGNDRPPVHEANEILLDQEQDPFEGIPDEELTVEQQRQRIKQKEQLSTVQNPQTHLKNCQLLVNVVKAEDLMIMYGNKCDPFVSCRAAGNVLKTPVQENSQKPSFKTRFKFPVQWPVHNANIVLYLWDRRHVISDLYVGQVPEFPSDNEFFNLNFLQSQGGIMGYRWFNIYGIPNEERTSTLDKILGKKQSLEGTQYMGRILLSFSLSRCDKPDLGLQSLGAYREPRILKCILRVHTYEIQGSFDFGECLKVVVKVGGKEFVSHHVSKKQRKQEKKTKKKTDQETQAQQKKATFLYEWSYSLIKKQDLKIDLPINIEEQPDIFISIHPYDKQNKDLKNRLAFHRMKRNSQDLQNSEPAWYPLKYVQQAQQINSLILCNIQLMSETEAIQEQEQIIKRTVKIPYRFRAYIYAGYDLCPHIRHDFLQCELEIILNGMPLHLKRRLPKGHNPIWNEVIEIDLDLDEKLEFASNLVLVLKNKYKKEKNFWEKYVLDMFQDNDDIGEAIIPLHQMNTQIQVSQNDAYQQFKPEFEFYHIKHKGISKGRILAAFHLFQIDPNNQEEIESQDGNFIIPQNRYVDANIELPIIGVRNMDDYLKYPCINIRVPQDSRFNPNDYWECQIKYSDTYEEIITKYPNGIKDPTFCKIATTYDDPDSDEEEDGGNEEEDEQIQTNIDQYPEKNLKNQQNNKHFLKLPLKIPYDLKFIPQIEIELIDLEGDNSESYMYSLNLIEYIPWCKNRILQASIYEWFEEGKLSHLLQDLNIILDKDKNHLQQLEMEQNNEQSQRTLLSNTHSQQNLYQIEEGNEQDDNEENNLIQKNIPQGKNKNLTIFDKPVEDELNENDIKIDIPDEANKFQNPLFKQNKLGATPAPDQYSVSQKSFIPYSQRNSMIMENKLEIEQQLKIPKVKIPNVQIEKPIISFKTKDDSSKEHTFREQKIAEITYKIEKLQTLSKKYKDNLQIEDIRLKFMKCIQELKKSDIKESEFLNDNELEEANEGVDYGNREIMKDKFEEINSKQLPYKKYPLSKVSLTSKQGVLGLFSKVILKAHLKVEADNIDISMPYSQYRGESTQYSQYTGSVSTQKRKQKTTIGLVNYKSELDNPKYPFNIFEKKFLKVFNPEYGGFNLKCRVYILRCLNLSAQSSQIDGKQYFAGNQAKSSASSFCQLQVGDGDRTKKNVIKYINDDKNVIDGTLCPEFYKMFELDANLPNEWCLKVRIMNSGTLGSSEIGGFEIDLEDRILMYKDLRQRLSFQILEEFLQDELDQIQFKYDKKSVENKQTLSQEINTLHALSDALNQDIKLPIEFQELKHPNKSVCQGTVEMLLEPFTEEIAQMVPFSYFEAPKPLEFELRVVIWDTKDIPRLNNNPQVSIMVQISLDKSATGTNEEITKETDVHNGSEDGNGQFNWRMVFPLVIPAKFPRLRLQCYDFHAFEGNELVGETVISLNKIIGKLRTQGKYEMEPSDFSLSHTNYPGEERGSVNITLQIISKQEATGSKVGEGQEEPNQNPFLTKPTEGRGIGDFVKGGFGFNLYGPLIKKILMYLAGVAVSGIITMILFIKPGILVN